MLSTGMCSRVLSMDKVRTMPPHEAITRAVRIPPLMLEWDQDHAEVVEIQIGLVSAIKTFPPSDPRVHDLLSASRIIDAWLQKYPEYLQQRSHHAGPREWNEQVRPQLKAIGERLGDVTAE